MARLFGTLLGLLGALIGLAVSAVVVLALLYDWNDLRPFIEDRVQAATGRNFEIQGNLDVDPGFTTTIHAENLRLANPDWAAPDTMAEVGSLDVSVDLVDTVFGNGIDLPRLAIDQAEVGLIRTEDGRANWQLGGGQQSGSGGPALPDLGHFEITNSRITLRDAMSGRNGDGRIETLTADAAIGRAGNVLKVAGQGSITGEPVQLDGSVGTLARLKDDAPYPLDLSLSAKRTRVQVDGTIQNPMAPKAFNVAFELDAPEPSETLTRLGLPEVLSTPLDLKGQLRHQGQTWSVSELSGLIGDRKVNGSASIDLSKDPPAVQADLSWDAFKPIIEAAVQAALGREFRIGGELDVEVGDVTRISAGMLNLANPAWAEDRWMAQVDQLKIAFRLWQALDGTYKFERIEVDGPNVRLTRDSEGRTNWTLGGGSQSGSQGQDGPPRTAIPEIDRLLVSGGTLRFKDAISDVDFEGELGTIEVKDEAGEVRDDFEIGGQGTLAGQDFEVQAEAGGLQILRRQETPYPLSLDLSLGDTSLEAKGTIDQPLAFKGFDMDFGIEGPNPGPLLARFDLPRLTTPPYQLSGHLSRKGQTWRLTNADGKVGDTDIQGTISAHPEQQPLLITADLFSQNFDLDDVGGLIGLSPSGEPRPESKGLLPDAQFDPQAWQNVNFDVRFQGDSVQARGVPLNSVEVDADLKDGLLTLDPVKVAIAGGEALLYTSIDATQDPPAADLDLRLERLGVDALVPDSELTSETAGKISGRIKLTSTGRSVKQIAGGANGRVGLTMGGGQINALLLEAVSLDLAEALALMVDQEDTTGSRIRCMVADFEVEQGILASQALVLDTEDMNITGAGSIDLGAEVLDLVLRPHPKDASLFSATTPIHITGPLSDPQISPETGNLIAKGAAALGLGIALPVVGAVIPFIETGIADDSPCAELIQRAKQATQRG